MALTMEQIKVIKNSWGPFRRIDPKLVGDVFYSKLFMESPSLRRLFAHNMDEQYQKLIEMLNIIVSRLHQADQLTNDIAQLARRHVKYGVKEEHYTAVGRALLWTIEQGMGRDWTPEIASAWSDCYSMLSKTMIEASGYRRAKA